MKHLSGSHDFSNVFGILIFQLPFDGIDGGAAWRIGLDFWIDFWLFFWNFQKLSSIDSCYLSTVEPSGECASPSGRRTLSVVVEFHVFCHKLFQLIDQVDIDKRLSKFDFLLFSC